MRSANGVPDWMDAALRRALHPDPVARYNGLSEFIADIRHPAASWVAGKHVPLIDRNPLAFWRGVSAVLLFICIALSSQLTT